MILSFIFYILSNLGVWLQGSMYPMNLAGLIQSYIMAIPFYRNPIIGDVFFTALLFGTYHLLVMATKTNWVQNILPFTINNNKREL